MWQKLALLALAGALGTLARVGLSTVVTKAAGGNLPWGTVAVNVLGCFLFGLVWELTEAWVTIGTEARLIVLGGFMGAFTTFSTYVFDMGKLAQDSRIGIALGNLVLQNAVGILFLFLGLAVGRAFA